MEMLLALTRSGGKNDKTETDSEEEKRQKATKKVPKMFSLVTVIFQVIVV